MLQFLLKYWLLITGLLIALSCNQTEDATSYKVTSGKLEALGNVPSKYITPRQVHVWLPDDYPEADEYAVIYMHDGQMLFDAAQSWNDQEWKVDEVLGRLLTEPKLQRKAIVVGVANGGELRHREYFPQKAFEMMDAGVQNNIRSEYEQLSDQELLADNYLKFLVEELKPIIDKKYATSQDKDLTCIMGSSMGGLISLYAYCEYPEVFGRAACLSTHWTGIFSNVSNPIPDALLAYLDQHLPEGGAGGRMYFDLGTETLDTLYLPHQMRVDSLISKRDYSRNQIRTRIFKGHKHDEASWASRLNIPLSFLLNP